MQERTLSSAWTFWAKFVFPAVWITGFGTGTIQLWLGGHDNNNAMPPPEMKFMFLAGWLLGSVFMLWASAGLKRVRIDDQRLYVSNYVKEISIPFGAIVDVQQNRWLNSRPVTIYFRETTELGDTAKFMPKWRIRALFWRVDPVVNELKELAGIIS